MVMATADYTAQSLSSLWIFMLAIKIQFYAGESANLLEVERHLELGRDFLARGQLTDALAHFHAAVEGDPNNYLTYFKRATVFLALSKSKSALPDLNKVLELKPDFTAARLQRGSVLLKQGRLDEAHIDFEAVLRREPHNPEALRYYNSVGAIARDIQTAQMLLNERDYYSAVDLLSRIIEICPWDPHLREMRAEGFIQLGDLVKAISDIKPTTKLRSDNTEAYLKLSSLHYELGEAEESLTEIRECLKLDPDHKGCFPFYKKVKKLAGQIKSVHELIGESRYEDCVEKANQMLKTEPQVGPFVFKAKSHMCHCLMKSEKSSEAVAACTEAVKLEESAPAYCDRAEAYIQLEQFDDAAADYQRAMNIDESMNRAQEGHQRVQKLIKQSKKRDYYKILGVKRTAAKRDILKAYRKLAQKWHPDNFQDADEKKKAEKKFMDIASAKEVLTDPEKREKYDHGEDPLDPESQGGQGFNPFQQGFHPFGSGGPFQFKFHFN